jgi:hypothetical protein
VATQIAVEIAARATMTAWTPTPTSTPVPTETVPPTDTPTLTPVPSDTPTPAPTETPPPHIEAEEYAVYADLIEQNPINFDLGSFIVIRGQTVSGLDSFERTLEQVAPLPAKLVDSYRSRNGALYTLEPKLDLEQDYTLMPEEEVASLFRRGGATWDDFEDQYPKARGIVIFSRVGFGENDDEALVEMGFRCPGLCGAGGLYLLVKEEGSWKVKETLMAWIS